MPRPQPVPPPGDGLPPGGLPDDVPSPDRPGRTAGRAPLVATGRDDGGDSGAGGRPRRHVVDVPWGELVDPEGLTARCGAAVDTVVPGLTADRADCPACRATGWITQ